MKIYDIYLVFFIIAKKVYSTLMNISHEKIADFSHHVEKVSLF